MTGNYVLIKGQVCISLLMGLALIHLVGCIYLHRITCEGKCSYECSAPHISEGHLYLQVRGVDERTLITWLKLSLPRQHYRLFFFFSNQPDRFCEVVEMIKPHIILPLEVQMIPSSSFVDLTVIYFAEVIGLFKITVN